MSSAADGRGTLLDVILLFPKVVVRVPRRCGMKSVASLIAVASLVFAAACNREPKVDEVPVGSDVQLTRANGALVEGKLLERDAKNVKVDVGPATKSVSRDDIADIRVKTDTDSALPKAAKFREIMLPADTKLVVRLDTAVDSETSRVETPVRGEITEAVVHDGVTVIPAGSTVSGVVSHAEPSGRVQGRASLSLAFDELTIDSTHYPLSAHYARTAPSTKAKDAKTIGIPAAGGAVIGAIVGGKKGAAIGAAAGGGAGTAVVLTTSGKEVAIGQGTLLTIEAGRTITVRVPL